jgi:hypothetical protein
VIAGLLWWRDGKLLVNGLLILLPCRLACTKSSTWGEIHVSGVSVLEARISPDTNGGILRPVPTRSLKTAFSDTHALTKPRRSLKPA